MRLGAGGSSSWRPGCPRAVLFARALSRDSGRAGSAARRRSPGSSRRPPTRRRRADAAPRQHHRPPQCGPALPRRRSRWVTAPSSCRPGPAPSLPWAWTPGSGRVEWANAELSDIGEDRLAFGAPLGDRTTVVLRGAGDVTVEGGTVDRDGDVQTITAPAGRAGGRLARLTAGLRRSGSTEPDRRSDLALSWPLPPSAGRPRPVSVPPQAPDRRLLAVHLVRSRLDARA